MDEVKVEAIRCELTINGIVQGVGFRPHIYKLAKRYNLNGYVVNTPKGVLIDIEGDGNKIRIFIDELKNGNLPPLSKIYNIKMEQKELIGYSSFQIKESIEGEEKITLISPDICVCEDCLREMNDIKDRRYRYPFINCTNCGPRYTIIKALPYDRIRTTMEEFQMCEECSREYNDPMDRRFHAQPNACVKCGPNVQLVNEDKIIAKGDEAIKMAISLLGKGMIVAIKGIGGFHLAVDASNDFAVKRLREKKGREKKPFAIMVKNEEMVNKICKIKDEERQFLLIPQRPILLIEKNDNEIISEAVSPNNRHYGIFLPYTPLHYMLMEGNYPALVMTSGNLSEEPICKDNEEAYERLKDVADFFLVHNRKIYQRCDDSVIAIVRGMPLIIRRSRGYAPEPIMLPFKIEPVIATGAHLKNTVCLGIDDKAIVSQHIGDLETYENFVFFHETIEHIKSVYSVKPVMVICDMHPNYLSTRYAEEQSLPIIKVQHHEAHIAACMAENHLQDEVIGISMDGTGYGTDGKIWGSEFFIGKPGQFTRVAHFEYVSMVGGDVAAKEPYRMAISYLYKYMSTEWLRRDLEFINIIGSEKINRFIKMMEIGINTPQTCGCGRLFDAISALVNLCIINKYEGQAPLELEMLITRDDKKETFYPFDIIEKKCLIISFKRLFEELIKDLSVGEEKMVISIKFHNTLVRIIKVICERMREKYKINKVVLSGGCFQNRYLLKNLIDELDSNGFEVYYHQQVPPNDGGISLGQIYTYALLKKSKDMS